MVHRESRVLLAPLGHPARREMLVIVALRVQTVSMVRSGPRAPLGRRVLKETLERQGLLVRMVLPALPALPALQELPALREPKVLLVLRDLLAPKALLALRELLALRGHLVRRGG